MHGFDGIYNLSVLWYLIVDDAKISYDWDNTEKEVRATLDIQGIEDKDISWTFKNNRLIISLPGLYIIRCKLKQPLQFLQV